MWRRLLFFPFLIVVTVGASACSGSDAAVNEDIKKALAFVRQADPIDAPAPVARIEFVDNRRASAWWAEEEQGDISDARWWVEQLRNEVGDSVEPQRQLSLSPVVASFNLDRAGFYPQGEHRDIFGYGLEDVRFAVKPQLSGEYTVLAGSFDRGAIQEALENDPDWAEQLQTGDVDGVEYWHWGDELDYERGNTLWRGPLGNGGQLYLDDDESVVVRTDRHFDGVEEALERSAESNLGSDEALLQLLTAMQDAGAMSAVISGGTQTREDAARNFPQILEPNGPIGSDPIPLSDDGKDLEQRIMASRTIPTKGRFVTGIVFDSSPTEAGAVLLFGTSFDTSADAETAAALLRESVEAPINGASLTELTESIEIAATDRFVLMSVVGVETVYTYYALEAAFIDS